MEAQGTAIPVFSKLKNGLNFACRGRPRWSTVPMPSVHRWTRAVLENTARFLRDSRSQITAGEEEVGGPPVSSAVNTRTEIKEEEQEEGTGKTRTAAHDGPACHPSPWEAGAEVLGVQSHPLLAQ